MPFVRSVFDVPNIRGTLATAGCIWKTYTVGCFKVEDASPNEGTTSGDSEGTALFSANLSNAVYQDGATIRPQSISVLVLLRL